MLPQPLRMPLHAQYKLFARHADGLDQSVLRICVSLKTFPQRADGLVVVAVDRYPVFL